MQAGSKERFSFSKKVLSVIFAFALVMSMMPVNKEAYARPESSADASTPTTSSSAQQDVKVVEDFAKSQVDTNLKASETTDQSTATNASGEAVDTGSASATNGSAETNQTTASTTDNQDRAASLKKASEEATKLKQQTANASDVDKAKAADGFADSTEFKSLISSNLGNDELDKAKDK